MRDWHATVAHVPADESAARFMAAIGQLHRGLRSIGVDPVSAWEVVTRCGLDSVPSLRYLALRALIDREGATTAELADATSYPVRTIGRHLADLAMRQLVTADRTAGRERWSLTDATAELLRRFEVQVLPEAPRPARTAARVQPAPTEAEYPGSHGTSDRPPNDEVAPDEVVPEGVWAGL